MQPTELPSYLEFRSRGATTGKGWWVLRGTGDADLARDASCSVGFTRYTGRGVASDSSGRASGNFTSSPDALSHNFVHFFTDA